MTAATTTVDRRDVTRLPGPVASLPGEVVHCLLRMVQRPRAALDEGAQHRGHQRGSHLVGLAFALLFAQVFGAGALLAQYQGFADVQMGIGMIVWGLASVIIGRALIGSDSIGAALTGTIMGSVFFRLIIAMALRWGLNPNDLKLVTAIFVFGALVVPMAMQNWRRRAAAS